MAFAPQPDATHATARRVIIETVRELEAIAEGHEKHKRKAAESDVRAMINAITNCADLRLKDR